MIGVELRSPFLIRMMLSCYYSPTPQEEMGDSWLTPAGQQCLEWLRSEALIDDDNKATGRGMAWVDYICNTPLPEQRWVLPQRLYKQPE
jgi:hypothetical protein